MEDTFFNAISRNRGIVEKVKRLVYNEAKDEPIAMEDIIRVAVETTRTHDSHFDRSENAYKIASIILEPGDIIRASRCGGRRQTFTFAGWDGKWATSKSGKDDIGPADIDKVNGITVNFSAMWNQRMEVLYETFSRIKECRVL